jgi:hypothetical protein
VGTDQPGMTALEEIEARPPHQRSVGEDPEIRTVLRVCFIHLLDNGQA